MIPTLLMLWADEPAPANVDPPDETTLKFEAKLEGDPFPIDFSPCANPVMGGVNPTVTGSITFQVVFKKKKVELVTVTSPSADFGEITPCLERQLAEFEWGKKKGEVEVQVEAVSGE